MYKNQLQELAQRSCFNLPAYSCIREGPDHAPRFKATVNFNGEVFESPNYCSTLRQAEHAAAEVALNTLSKRGPSQSLAARILDETGVYKNLLQEIAQRAGAPLPVYTTVRSGLGHLPVFTCTVELAGIKFRGEPAKNKKQAEKNAAMAACSSLRQFAHQSGFSSQASREGECNEEQEQITIARALANHRQKELAILKQQSVAKKRLLAQRENSSCYSIRESSSHSIRESSGHSIRESSSHSIEHQHFGGAQWVSSDLSSDGCSRFNSSHNQHLQQKLHLPASTASGSKILPFIRSILPQRNRSGSLPDSASGSSMSSETITTNRDASAACVRNTNTLSETLPLVLAREAIATNRADASTRRVHRPTPHQVSILFEEHERDEEEWLRGDLPRDNNSPTLGISNLAEWVSAFASTNSLPWPGQSSWNMQRHQQQHHQQLMSQNITQRPVSSFGGSRCLVSSPSPSMVAPPVRIRTSIPVCSAPPPRRSPSEFLGSDFLSHDTNLIHSPMHTAPAVRIRSVAPVCSAPSRQRTLPQDLNRNSLQEEDSTLELLNQLRL